MDANLFFDFIVDKENKTVIVKREFNAPLDNVWAAWTEAELLDQWWAPKPWRSETQTMDFREGGRRFYAMVSPDGAQKSWQIQDYTSITPKTGFKFFSAFADEDQNAQLPGSNWDLTFTAHDTKTSVIITIYNDSLQRMEKMIEMGFKEGFTMGLVQLEALLANQNRNNKND